MPTDKPVRGHPVTIRVAYQHAAFLRRYFAGGRAGMLEDLKQPHGLADPDATRAYAVTCGRIIYGIDRGEIVADTKVIAVLIEQWEVNDGANRYECVVREHEAFAHLLCQVNEGNADGPERRLTPGVCRQRLLLHKLLEPPDYGGFLSALARALPATLPDTELTAAALEEKGLATVRDGYAAATGVAIDFHDLCPSAV